MISSSLLTAVVITCWQSLIILFKLLLSRLNTGNQIILGLEIIKSLRNIFKINESLPFIFDDVSNLDNNNLKRIINDCQQVITTAVSNEEEIKMITLN